MTDSENKTCETCEHYIRHYYYSGKYQPVWCGHCIAGRRPKRCNPDKKACADWCPQSAQYRRRHLPPKRKKVPLD